MELISYFSTTSVSVLYFVFAYAIFCVQKKYLPACSRVGRSCVGLIERSGLWDKKKLVWSLRYLLNFAKVRENLE